MGFLESGQYTLTSLQAALGVVMSGGGMPGLGLQIPPQKIDPWPVLIQHQGPSCTRLFLSIIDFVCEDELTYPRIRILITHFSAIDLAMAAANGETMYDIFIPLDTDRY